jgi:hypothetical protein
MRLRWRAGLVLACAAIGPAAAVAQPPAAKGEKQGNAALKYWQAFALMPRFDEAQQAILTERDRPLDKAAHKLIEDGKNSLANLHRGAELRQCDWGLNLLEDGIEALLPHLSKARELANLGLLRARWNFEQRKFQAGLDDVGDVLTLCRHVGTDGTLISLVVQMAIEQASIELTARYLPAFDAEDHRRLAARLDALPPGGTISAAVLMERETAAKWMMRQLRAQNYGVNHALEAAVRAAGGPAGPTKQLEELIANYEELARIAALPRDQFETKWAAAQKKLEGNAFARQLLPALDKVYDAAERNRTVWALLHAAHAVAQGGPDRLKDFPDPVGSGAFEYREFPGGFELKSKLVYKGQPLVLKVGTPKPE